MLPNPWRVRRWVGRWVGRPCRRRCSEGGISVAHRRFWMCGSTFRGGRFVGSLFLVASPRRMFPPPRCFASSPSRCARPSFGIGFWTLRGTPHESIWLAEPCAQASLRNSNVFGGGTFCITWCRIPLTSVSRTGAFGLSFSRAPFSLVAATVR